jgi:hypothetical protein
MSTKVPEKTCKRCKVSKPLTLKNWVQNRPRKNGRPDLPRGVHDTCKLCESLAKVAAWKARKEAQKAASEAQMAADLRRLKGL